MEPMLDAIAVHLLVVVLAYGLGSLPFGLWLTKMAGLGDIRAIGSGNIGATNVLRTGKKGLAAATLLLDMLKGYAAVWLATQFAPEPVMAEIAGMVAVLGHNFPIWLKFRGGKGVATSLGVILALDPLLGGLVAASWVAVFAFTRISSMAAIVAAFCAPFFTFVIGDPSIFWLMLGLSTLLILRHHSNIKRLISGEEPLSKIKKPRSE